MTRVTLADIAERTGYSLTTVGKVLNGGSSSIRISESTRNKIKTAAAQMHYQPNAMASALRKGRGNLIGLLGDSMAGRRISLLVQEIERQADARSLRVLTSLTHDDVGSMYSNHLALLNHGAAGVICLAHDYPGMQEQMCKLFANDDRIVFLEQPLWNAGYYAASSRQKALTEYFSYQKRRGCRRFAVIHGKKVWISERALLTEFRAALEANNIEFLPDLAIEYPDECSSLEEVCEYIINHLILPFKPDVLFSDDAEHALYLQNRLLANGIHPPVICGGNNDPFFKCAAPQIQSLDPRYDQIASVLIDAVLNREKFVSGTVIEALSPETVINTKSKI